MFTALVSVLLAASSTPPLRVEITSPKTQVSIFEPLKLTVRATADQSAVVPSISNTAASPGIETWVDYEDGFVRYVDNPRDYGDGFRPGRRLTTGEHLVKTVVLVEGRIGDQETVPFPYPGRYTVRVVFRARPEGGGVAGIVLGESNTITFEVVAPDADGQRLVERIRTHPWVLRGGLYDAEYQALLAQFPASPYLHWGKRAIALEKKSRIGNGRYPHNDEIFDEAAQGVPLAKTLFRELAIELLDADNWGQFDEERLQLAAENMALGGAYDEARPIWLEILERFPGSAAAEEAKSRLDSTPPSLDLAASPAALWPPNHRLEPITVSVEVSDDQDPNPRVNLVSIACDDACDPAVDIVDAVYGTDDRQFQLRSERKGMSTAGRTYTITYSATDASGNSTLAAATVVVPHDEGKK